MKYVIQRMIDLLSHFRTSSPKPKCDVLPTPQEPKSYKKATEKVQITDRFQNYRHLNLQFTRKLIMLTQYVL